MDEDMGGEQVGGGGGSLNVSIDRVFVEGKKPSRAEIVEFRARFAAIYEEYGPRVWRKLVIWRVGLHSIRDLHQDIFAKVWELAETAVPADVALTIGAVTWRLLCNYLRERKRRPRPTDDADLDLIQAPVDPERAAHARRLVHEVAPRMSAGDAQLLEWIDVEGRSYEEAAAELGVPVGTLKKRLHTARKRFIVEVEEESES